MVTLSVGLGGLEPPTSSLSAKRSNRLSYRPVTHMAERRDYRNQHAWPKPDQSRSANVTSIPPTRSVVRL
jgi:hypothetical protein